MKQVFIKYNPYKLETEVTVDGKKLADNSKLGEKITPGSRLQEWVEELPHILIDECNDTDFNIIFHGTLLDFEDLKEVFTLADKRGELKATLDRKPAKETSDKEVLIDNIFKEIQNGPFDELRDSEILNAFQNAKSSNFEVCVVATMSAGKSTLINSMLRTKLMPSKQEACTAIITKIEDTKIENTNDSTTSWQAEVYNKNNKNIESYHELTYSTMKRLNEDENVYRIEVKGNIPFVSSEDVSLVLIDTPGPNNSRDPKHKKVQREFLSKSSKSLVLYIMDGTFGSDDDNALLKRVADSMKVGGKQSKDRFIFVVNKMDDRKKEDGDIKQTLERVRLYLKNHGINNPNIFPVAALPALNIRLISSGAEVDEDTLDETELKVNKLNGKRKEEVNKGLHLENYASLPSSIRSDINRQLSDAKKVNDKYAEALIHTGIISLEAAIRQYVQKYAKTAKIKNIADTFMHKLDEVGCFEEAKRELAQNRDESERIVSHINNIRRNIDDVKSAEEFGKKAKEILCSFEEKAKDVINGIVVKYQAKITCRIDEVRGKELEIDEVNLELIKLKKFAKELEPEFQTELDDLIKEKLIKTIEELLKKYKDKLASLTEDIKAQGLSGINIDPLSFMQGTIMTADEFYVKKLVQSKEVEDGEEWVENYDKKWYKPWTWFQESGYYKKKYKTVEYVDASELAQEYLTSIERAVYKNGEDAMNYAKEQSKKTKGEFNKEIERLNNIINQKLSELEIYATDKEKAEKRIKESESKLKWLETIKANVESILEI